MKGFDKRTMDALFSLCILLLSIPVSAHLLDILFERTALGYFGAPSDEDHSFTVPSPSVFDIP